MQQLIQKNKAFFAAFALYFLVGGFLIMRFGKGEMELLINRGHTHLADQFFSYFTHVGDGLFFVIFSILLLFYRWKWGLLSLLSFALSGILAQFFKKVLFPGAPRPRAFFGETASVYYVPGVEIFTSQSFPSGHSASAFAMFCLLALLLQNQWTALLCVLLAITASFSRVYLMQHFFIDTYFGALLGFSISLGLYVLFVSRFNKST